MFSTVSSPSKRETLQYVYTRLVKRANKRSSGVITTDDVHAILDTKGYPRSPTRRLSIIRTLLNDSLFFNLGSTVPSAREVAKLRQVSEWTL